MQTEQMSNDEIGMIQVICKRLGGLDYEGKMQMLGRMSYVFHAYPSATFAIYVADLQYIFDLVSGTGSAKEYTIERRNNNLKHELERSAVFLVGEIRCTLEETE